MPGRLSAREVAALAAAAFAIPLAAMSVAGAPREDTPPNPVKRDSFALGGAARLPAEPAATPRPARRRDARPARAKRESVSRARTVAGAPSQPASTPAPTRAPSSSPPAVEPSRPQTPAAAPPARDAPAVPPPPAQQAPPPAQAPPAAAPPTSQTPAEQRFDESGSGEFDSSGPP